ncbi:hypothetical protein G6F32_016948 [Rhizopus arrhizus]|nr:hypothetical protein G6F32_016948 [Rhizopus arrhizus]
MPAPAWMSRCAGDSALRIDGRIRQIHAMRGCHLQSRATLDSSRVAQQQPSVARLYIAPAQPNAARWAM